jgi:hypothetical protein
MLPTLYMVREELCNSDIRLPAALTPGPSPPGRGEEDMRLRSEIEA